MLTLEMLKGAIENLNNIKPQEKLWLTSDVYDAMVKIGCDMNDIERIDMTPIKGINIKEFKAYSL